MWKLHAVIAGFISLVALVLLVAGWISDRDLLLRLGLGVVMVSSIYWIVVRALRNERRP